MTLTFFNTLCFAELETIVLSVSKRPNLHEWSDGTNEADLYSLLDTKSPFRIVIHTLLGTELRQVWKKVRSETQFNELSTLLRAGDLLKCVSLSSENILGLSESALISSFAKGTPNLRALALTGSLGEESTAYSLLLSKIGGRIKELRVEKWNSTWLPPAVRRTCRPRDLTIQCTSDGAVADNKFWKSIGPTLRKLTITYHSNILWLGDDAASARLQLIEIEKHCKSLRAICVFTPPEAGAALASALNGYGRKLKLGFLWLPSVPDAALVAGRCLSARFGLLLRSNTAAPILNQFERRTHDLRLIGDIGSVSEAELQAALAKCTSLHKLYTDVDVHVVTPLLQLHYLQDLEINPDAFRCAPDDVLRALTKSTGDLKYLTLYFLPPTAAALHKLLVVNGGICTLKLGVCKPNSGDPVEKKLDYRQINFDDEDDVYTYYGTLLRGLKQRTPMLYNAEIESRWIERSEKTRSSIIAEACVPLRNRKLYINVDSWNYLPADEPA